MTLISEELRKALIEQAGEAGFDAVRFVSLDRFPETATRGLAHYLEAGRHGDMQWMAETAERRGHPNALWPEARSAILLGKNYAPADDPMDALKETDRGVISCYAKGKDYHDLVKRGLKRVAGCLERATGAGVKVFVDTAPVMEKPLAAAAGLGWQGKHTNLVSRAFGSWLFLGSVFTTAELTPDAPEDDHCGNCRRCLDICPTKAFPAPYQLDARRCLAYLTIEYKGHIAREFREPMGNRVFGCDDCLAVCPWNKFADRAADQRLHARVDTDNPPLGELLAMDDAAFRARFRGTPVKRTGRDRFLRNVLIAVGNSGDAGYLAQVEACLRDPSALVRAMAVWAFSRLAGGPVFAALRDAHLAGEPDADVRAEWEG